MSSDDFTYQVWCDHCGGPEDCNGEHSAFIASVPATGGDADKFFTPGDDTIEVPAASVHVMYSEHPTDTDDAPFVALRVTDGNAMLRPHEAAWLASKIIDAQIIARRGNAGQ